MPWLRVCGLSLLVAALAAQAAAQDPALEEDQTGPTVQFRGFADIDYAETDSEPAADGFYLGYLVGSLSASLGRKFSAYSEVTLTQRNNAFVLDVARLFLRYDYNDRFKISVGRYHAPVTYWATAFHRGAWLQTTVFRPDYVKDEWFQPDHFLGVMAEGTLVPRAGLGYIVGYGNGREVDLRDSGFDAADLYGDRENIGHHRAAVVRLFARPPQISGVEFGGAVYRDELAANGSPGVPELITSAYVAITGEAPELIAELSNLKHTWGPEYNSQAYYVQLGYRIPAQPTFKPYARYEHADAPDDEPITGPLANSRASVGLRCELNDLAALKVEFAQRRRPGAPHVNGLFVQAAFTF
ncbi:MAG: hypothetical protein A3H97_06465 [Acidobacteria bacterium RIFCSPLOWO2_02_FULL_65_29]|nr:MAG: hypothetical protein A3H97_06465 [Acidobacteria bacterium RIFCSPLOWO2_02_FULL_65_29]